MADYYYTPLRGNEVRLIELHPAAFADVLQISIMHAPLTAANPSQETKRLSRIELRDSLPAGWEVFETIDGRYLFDETDAGDNAVERHPDPQQDPATYAPREFRRAANGVTFEALSYTWGDLASHEDVQVRSTMTSNAGASQTSASVLRVGQNLGSALRHLRRANSTRTFWIDAICIDQTNIDERNLQVSRMGEIFGLASKVVIWLGPASVDSLVALTTLQYLSQQVEVCKPARRLRPKHAVERDWWKLDHSLPYDDSTWNAIVSLFQRPWFERLWIVQEVNLANPGAEIHCGHDTISLAEMQCAVGALELRADLPGKVTDNLVPVNGALRGDLFSWTEVLAYAGRRKCSDARDKIYGVLSLAPPAVAKRVQPQYSSSLAQVYRDAFSEVASATKRLDFLSLIMREAVVPNLPSWTPDLSAHRKISLSTVFNNQASGNSKAIFRINGNILDVCGTLVTSITSTSATIRHKDDLKVAQPALQTDKLYPTGEDAETAYARLLRLDWVRERFPRTLFFPTVSEWKDEVKRNFAATASTPKYEDFPDHVFRTICDSSICETEKGYFGFVPSTTQCGDVIVVILGFFLPLVLRRSALGPYRVIGTCHVHGLMNNEAFLGPLPPGWAVRQTNTIFQYEQESTQGFFDDPRLDALDEMWESFFRERAFDDPMYCVYLRNKSTGEEIHYDPRLLPEALERRGVALQTISLA